MAEVREKQATQVKEIKDLIEKVRWEFLQPRNKAKIADWITNLLKFDPKKPQATSAYQALQAILPPSPEPITDEKDPRYRSRFQGEEGKERVEAVNREVERAYLEHVLTVWANPMFTPYWDYQTETEAVTGDYLESHGLNREFLFVPEAVEKYRKRISDLTEESGAGILTPEAENRLAELTAMNLGQKMRLLEKNPGILTDRIAEVRQLIEERDELKRLRKKRREELKAKKDEKESQEMKKYEEVYKYHQFAEVMRRVPLLESTYRQAFAELRADNLFLDNFTIPSLKEICEPLFGITQPGHYTRFNGITYKDNPEIYNTVIETLNKNPNTLLSLMKMGLTGGYPDVVEYSEDAEGEIHFADCSKESPLGRRNLDYQGSVAMAEKMGLKTEKTAGLMDPYFYKNVFQEIISNYDRENNRTGGFDYFGGPLESEKWSWSWLETDKKTLASGNAVDGFRDGAGVDVDRGDAHFHNPYGGWRASLRVKKA